MTNNLVPEKKIWCNDPTLTPICKWCLEEILGMKSYSLVVNCCVFLDGKLGYFDPPDHIFLAQDLNGRDPNRKSQLRTLFHELRHYYQFKMGIYDFISKEYQTPLPENMSPRDKTMIRFLQYLKFPWEIDANQFAEDTMPKFKKSSFASSFSSS